MEDMCVNSESITIKKLEFEIISLTFYTNYAICVFKVTGKSDKLLNHETKCNLHAKVSSFFHK